MKYCLNNLEITCTRSPMEITHLSYENVIQPDDTTKQVWHKHVSCALSHPSCGNKAYAQLPLTIK